MPGSLGDINKRRWSELAESYMEKAPGSQLHSKPLRMAPSLVYMTPSLVYMTPTKMTPREKNKIRKPAVEKMRRDRINSSIEQLKRLLEKHFQAQQPNAKLEKADILEMAVSYLKEQSQPQTTVAPLHKHTSVDFREGYSRCFEEAVQFLSVHNSQAGTPARLFHHHIQVSEVPSAPKGPHPEGKQGYSKQPAAAVNPITPWRPW